MSDFKDSRIKPKGIIKIIINSILKSRSKYFATGINLN